MNKRSMNLCKLLEVFMLSLLSPLYLLEGVQTSVLNIFNGKYSEKHSYVEYPPWNDVTPGYGVLQFEFKVYKTGDLLYVSDGQTSNGAMKKHELQLVIEQDGILKAKFAMGQIDSESSKEIAIGKDWNDMMWHRVKVTRNFREVTIDVDGYEGAMVSQGESNFLQLSSNVMIGGSSIRRYGLHGCIRDVKYMTNTGLVLRTVLNRIGKVKDGCYDKCNINKCQNGGKCVKYFDDKEESDRCDCTSTGYVGKYCSEPEKIGFVKENQYITESTESLKISRVNIIQFRFRTNSPSGLILYHGRKTDYVIVELHHGNIHINIALGADPVTLKLGNGRLHDGAWHSFVLKRHSNKVNVTVDRFETSGAFKYQPIITCERQVEEFLYIGGHPNIKSSSKKNFIGCLQQVYFQENVLQLIEEREENSLQRIEAREMMKRALKKYPFHIRVNGGMISAGCPVKKKEIKEIKITVATTTTKTTSTRKIDDPHVSNNGKTKTATPIEQQSIGPKNKLSESTVAWITGGICVGSIALILTLACGFYFLRKRYSGQFSAQYKAASAARSVYGDMIPPVDQQTVYHGNQQFQVKRPKASGIL